MVSRRLFLTGVTCSAVLPRAATAGTYREAAEKAARFLLDCQHTDGSWKSDVYGAFRDGCALTPLVTLALAESGMKFVSSGLAGAYPWLKKNRSEVTRFFPVHNASWLLQASARAPRLDSFRKPVTDQLLNLQLNTDRGWQGHPFFGGWSYAHEAPTANKNIPPFQHPNLSATILAVDGLHAAGIKSNHKALQSARAYINRCQNFRTSAKSKFDDGGFFQIISDPTRNKAGIAGREPDGTVRLRSYTSATADGLRGLLRCGGSPQDARVQSAIDWLDRNVNLEDVPDLRFYTAASLTGTGSQLSKTGWLERTGAMLLDSQRPDGSWKNPNLEMREDDPMVATSLGLLAIAKISRS